MNIVSLLWNGLCVTIINPISTEKPIKTQRYYFPKCGQTFIETFDTLYYRRQIESEKMRMVLQAHVGGRKELSWRSLLGVGMT